MLTPLYMAMRFRDQKRDDMSASDLATLREAILAAEAAMIFEASADVRLLQLADAIMSITTYDMPADSDLVAVLLDAVAFKIKTTSRAEAWRHIGVSPKRGRDMLAQDSTDWPVWFTLREAAIGRSLK